VRGLVGALMLVGATAAVTAANMSLLLYADGHGARPGPPYSRAELRPAAPVLVAREPGAQGAAREAPGQVTADPVPQATDWPRTQRATADRESRPSRSWAQQNVRERTDSSAVQEVRQAPGQEQLKPAEESDRVQGEKTTDFTGEAREGDAAPEPGQQELDARLAGSGKGQERPATAAPAGEYDDD